VETKIKNVSVEDTALRPKILQFSGKMHRNGAKIAPKCLTKAGRDSTLKKKIELQQEQDEKDSQKIGRLRTSNGKEALRYDAVFL
jgi:hypothetical protein